MRSRRKTFLGSRMGSGRDAASTMRWMHWQSGLPGSRNRMFDRQRIRSNQDFFNQETQYLLAAFYIQALSRFMQTIQESLKITRKFTTPLLIKASGFKGLEFRL